jgi:hypothetical protein
MVKLEIDLEKVVKNPIAFFKKWGRIELLHGPAFRVLSLHL